MSVQRSSMAGQPVIDRFTVTVGGTGSQVVNVFKILGLVRVVEQAAEITRVGTLTNLTNLYATLYDGTNSEDLTADGAALSGMPVGTSFMKDKIITQPYSVFDASQCRVSETLDDKRLGKPFTVLQKSGTDTFIRMHYTTTDNPVDFDLFIHFEWQPINGGRLVRLV